MREISFKRHRFPPDVIRYAVWLYYRFTMSPRDVAIYNTFNLQRHLVSRKTMRTFRSASMAKVECRDLGRGMSFLKSGPVRLREVTLTAPSRQLPTSHCWAYSWAKCPKGNFTF